MPKLSTRQEGILYLAMQHHLLAKMSRSDEESKLHMKMCNHALIEGGFPIMSDLLRSFNTSIFGLKESENG